MSALVRWLPKLAVATADDIEQFGPNAARILTLLDFIPTMSKDAGRAAYATNFDYSYPAWQDMQKAAQLLADDKDFASQGSIFDIGTIARKRAAESAAWPNNGIDEGFARIHNASDAVEAELVSHLISPESYRKLTNPLAAGRAIDVLAPRYKNTPFREVLTELLPKKLITQPSDVLDIGRIASSPEEIRDIAMTLIADGGMTAEEAYQAARMLA